MSGRFENFRRQSTLALIGAVVLLGGTMGSHAPAIAGSDNSSDTYAGDYEGGSLPIGTFIAFEYLRFAHADAFVNSAGTVLPNSHANELLEFTRFTYFAQLGGHPFVIEADVPVATLTDVNIPGTNNAVAGGNTDPVFHLTYFFVADAKIQRWLGLTNYDYLPLGRSYDNQSAVNVSTARQFTDVPQVGYTEGLGKLSPTLNGVFFDLIANASFHTNGQSPLAVVNPATSPFPGVLNYSAVTQGVSYDVQAFLRYEPKESLWFAVGVEKSWGGEQIATNGTFAVTGTPIVIPQPNLSLGKDDFLTGHFEFYVPVARDFSISADVFHDFEAVGGFRENFGVEVRLAKFFFPQPSSKPELLTK
jgi:hypothetical protein